MGFRTYVSCRRGVSYPTVWCWILSLIRVIYGVYFDFMVSEDLEVRDYSQLFNSVLQSCYKKRVDFISWHLLTVFDQRVTVKLQPVLHCFFKQLDTVAPSNAVFQFSFGHKKRVFFQEMRTVVSLRAKGPRSLLKPTATFTLQARELQSVFQQMASITLQKESYSLPSSSGLQLLCKQSTMIVFMGMATIALQAMGDYERSQIDRKLFSTC